MRLARLSVGDNTYKHMLQDLPTKKNSQIIMFGILYLNITESSNVVERPNSVRVYVF